MRLLSLILLTLASSVAFAAKPGPTNTGPHTTGTGDAYENTIAACQPSCPASLTPYTGPNDITVDGTTIENFTYNGTIKIRADNVTLRNCVIDGGYNLGPSSNGSRYGVDSRSSTNSGIIVEDCEIRNQYSSGLITTGTTMRRLYVHSQGADAVKPWGNDMIQDSWFETVGYISGSHADMIQTRSGDNFVVTGNYFDCDIKNPKCSIAVLFQAAQSGDGGGDNNLSNVLIEGNWVNGGNYTIQLEAKTGYTLSNVTVRNNLFGPPRDNLATCSDKPCGSGANGSPRYGDIRGGNLVECNRRESDLSFLPDQDNITGCPAPPDSSGTGAPFIYSPTYSPVAGGYTSEQTVTLTSQTAGAVIHYTVDGSVPTTSSAVYSTPLSIAATTTVRALAFVDPDESYVSQAQYVISTGGSGGEPDGQIVSGATWQSIGAVSSGTTHTQTYKIIPGTASTDSVLGLSDGIEPDYTQQAALVRTYAGFFEARDGGSYTADAAIAALAGTEYEVEVVADFTAQTYTVSVTPDGGSKTLLATDYAFRDTSVTNFTTANIITSSGSAIYSDFDDSGGGGGGVTTPDIVVVDRRKRGPKAVRPIRDYSVQQGVGITISLATIFSGCTDPQYSPLLSYTGAPAGTTGPTGGFALVAIPPSAPLGTYTITAQCEQQSDPQGPPASDTFLYTVE